MAPQTTVESLSVEILTIGDELNRGEIVDTNSAWLASEITALGGYVRWRSSVTDDPADMKQALALAASRAAWVVCSGGLGPTEDDRTVDVVAAWLQTTIETEPAHAERLRERYQMHNRQPSEKSLRQVRVPSAAQVLPNRTGIAPGFAVRSGAVDFFFMPGVPGEMKPMFHEQVVPLLGGRLAAQAKTVKRAWRVAGLSESQIDEALRGVLNGIDDATLHFRLIYPECLVTIVVRRPMVQEAEATIKRLVPTIVARLGIHAYGDENTTLSTVIGRLLRERGQTLSVAESCTGGLMSELITAVPGSSDYFRGGAVTYANSVKENILGVSEQALMKHGAVSELVAGQMADGVRTRWQSDYALAITGVAGPTGGSADKPVGTVWIGVAAPGQPVRTKKIFWNGTREQIRLVAVHAALFSLWKLLNDRESDESRQ